METLNALTMKFQALGVGCAMRQRSRPWRTWCRREALVMSFADVFLLLTVLFLGLVCALPFIKKPRAAPAGGGGH